VQEKSLEVGKLKDCKEDEVGRPGILPYTWPSTRHLDLQAQCRRYTGSAYNMAV